MFLGGRKRLIPFSDTIRQVKYIITGVTSMESSVEIPQKAVNSAIPSLGIDPKVSISYYRAICFSMLIFDLFIIDNKWNQCRYPSHSELIIEM